MTRRPQESTSITNEKLKTTPIAIIGMGSIFPKARTKQDYWDNILRKIDCITDVPDSHWSVADYYDPDPSVPDKTYCKRGGFIPDVDFDPMAFGLPPNILEVTDVSQLLSLVVAKEALEDAGCGENVVFDRDHTGCVLGFVGTSSKLFTPLMTRLQYPVWAKVLRSVGISDGDTEKIVEKMKLAYVNWEENSFPGAIGNVVSGRICNRFDLGGMNCVVDAACASSLAAVRMAVGELIEGRANMMLTGGVDTDNSINSYMCFSKTPAFTKKDNVRSFDADSGGMMVGEGLGMVVLKRLEDAERDGDRVYAVIRAIGTSSDGRFKSIYAPRPSGQAKAMRRAYEEAGFPPSSVGLVEAHGTGTMAGDPAEFQGLNEAFSENNSRKQHIALGSVKSQIAHTKAAAGVASLMKTSLALYHKILPPTINVTQPNPKLGIENSPFYINTEARPWIRARNGTPRRAGVSSFGFGGTNFHVVLEESESEQRGAYRLNSVAQPVVLAASNPAQLLEACREALSNLQGELSLVNFTNLVQTSRGLEISQSAARLGFVAETVEEARQLLQIAVVQLAEKGQQDAWEHPKGIYYRKAGLDTRGKVVALFSGQGSQYLEMGRELAMNFPVVRDVFAAMDEIFISDSLEPLSTRVYPQPVFDVKAREAQTEALTRTENAQPAIGALSVSLFKLFQEAGFQADFTAGHSFGELTALWAAGVFSDDDYYALAKARGKAMAPPADPNFDAGTMVAVKGDSREITELFKDDPEVTLANWNSNNQVVIAGSKPAMARAQEKLSTLGIQAIPLPVSAAFHTPLVGHAQKPFAGAISQAKFCEPKTRVFSNSTGQAHGADPESIRTLLAGHILNPVLFRNEIENIYAEGGSIFIEFGPKNVLANLVGNILGDKPHLAVALNASPKKDSDRQLRDAVVALRVAGLPLKNFDPYAAAPKVEKPVKKSPVTVALNGSYYVSEKTRTAFEKSLNDGFRISLPERENNSPAHPAAVAAAPQISQAVQIRPAPVQAASTTENPVVMNNQPANQYETILADYQSHQSETLRLHEQYLRTEEEYARAFTQMTSLQAELISKGAGSLQSVLPLFESLERSMTRFHEHQAETLKVHQRYLEKQDNLSNSFLQSAAGIGPVVPAPVLAAVSRPAPAAARQIETAPAQPVKSNGYSPASVAAQAPTAARAAAAAPVLVAVPVVSITPPAKAVKPSGLDMEALKTALLDIVSDKTGYPVETLEMDMDMEADLGIDSIKRVEILGAMQTRFPELPKIEAAVLAELRTLGQIVTTMGSGLAEASTQSSSPVQAAAQAAPVATVAAPAVSSTSVDELTGALLRIVSEKTGYPAETLELDMDMEADLGIDSIKRVEILGAMQDQFPGLPKVEATVLAELRTLGQIVSHLSALGGQAAPAASAPQLSSPAQPTESAKAEAQPAPVGGSGPSIEIVTAALLAIVSDKTGYPVETLELDMNLEADLGIDSIKRVEILGALQAQFPELPKVEASVLAELGTLGQIIAHMSQLGEAQAALPSVGGAAESPFELGLLPRVDQDRVIRKILPAADSLDFKLPEKHICLVTDDGTMITPQLVQKMLGRGWPVVVLRYPTAVIPTREVLPDGAASVELVELSETALQSCLEQVLRQFGPTAVFIYLAPSMDNGQPDGVEFPEVEKALLKTVFLTAKHLKSDLTGAGSRGRTAFLTVTRLDGEFGLRAEVNYSPISGGLFGLVKTLNLEWESVFCRAVDLSPALETQQSVDCILTELCDPNRLISEVGYTLTERSTLVLTPVLVASAG